MVLLYLGTFIIIFSPYGLFEGSPTYEVVAFEAIWDVLLGKDYTTETIQYHFDIYLAMKKCFTNQKTGELNWSGFVVPPDTFNIHIIMMFVLGYCYVLQLLESKKGYPPSQA